jgi:hypothetical protein
MTSKVCLRTPNYLHPAVMRANLCYYLGLREAKLQSARWELGGNVCPLALLIGV